ncbi:MAG: sulfatase-like hydrolase/transferase [Armatimonadetes bacterium]|nr:sulfatase-like hydrolase/transferase [Armatimonadota bacterium]NIM24414.1 sulfatase-like hydrolase/transferase [Armatimonadota bacterium]NIM68285.1 sulfatase-like hydrolase/transferase [Armatimonadota bacterium]NIM76689.1 sulfatase-like hydrolase/transferase [Armatimonadota bacterium]NIN06488.1 sulfatase-like hydrolase/transferase [Armatimonadota bacterium]
MKGLYDGEIASIDHNIGRIIEYLRNEGIYDNTVIVVLADHGEEFWERGGLEHARTLHDEILRIPLILKLPPSANRRGERVSATVRQVDVYPTLLELAGVSLSSDIRGESLLHIDPAKSRWEYAETPYIAALRGEEWKFIAKSRPKQEELYNLEEDPAERKNVAAQHPQVLARMQEEMSSLMRMEEFASAADQEYKKVDPKTLERLRSLGYVK